MIRVPFYCLVLKNTKKQIGQKGTTQESSYSEIWISRAAALFSRMLSKLPRGDGTPPPTGSALEAPGFLLRDEI